MAHPTSTYRLQFRNGMTFDRACALVRYWQDLGVSHLYASPIFTAVSGSTHGYDITDANEIDPALGGRGAFDRLSAALKQAGIDLILDIVPNHMAASLENPWWRSVLELGPSSPYAKHFDIDWREPLTLPQLGATFEDVLAAGDLRLAFDARHRKLSFGYFDALYPLNPESSQRLLTRVDNLRDDTLAALSLNHDLLRDLHGEQHWRLMHWKDAAAHLSYRRFFEVTGLVGVRVEQPEVFDATHWLPLALVRSGQVQGLRIDHIDGLADPKGYLLRLREMVGPGIYLVVEKILGQEETIDESWPVAGTTGYEFIAAMPDLIVEPQGLQELDRAYRGIAGNMGDFHAVLRSAKELMVTRNFAGEVGRLARLAGDMDGDVEDRDIIETIRAMLIGFPVYRIYGTDGPLEPRDMRLLEGVVAEVREERGTTPGVDLIDRLLKGQVAGNAARGFRTRFQQLSGPVMAKAMEDTSFYRHNRLIALNEVGGEPMAAPAGVDGFHARMAQRLATQPYGLSATSTHDTKRGEDARARLYALSEGADLWIAGVARWREMNRHLLVALPDGPAPEPNVEWMLYQSLAGLWPEAGQGVDHDALAERLAAYAEKALREAKIRTDWAEPNERYERAVTTYARALLAADNGDFLADFQATLAPFIAAGALNSMAQTLVKLTAPGIPDIYQGAEGFDLSLVDPDNRRPPVFARLTQGLDISKQESGPAERKQRIIRAVLHLRARQPALFAEGAYLPLEVTGAQRNHVLAFARQLDGIFAITIVSRLMFGQLRPDALTAVPDFWGDTEVVVPAPMAGAKVDLLSDSAPESGRLLLGELLDAEPVSLLVSPGCLN